MRRIAALSMLLSLMALLFVTCKKDEPDDPAVPGGGAGNPYGTGNGAVTFYCTSSAAHIMSITLNSVGIGTLDHYYNSAPSCGTSLEGSMISMHYPVGTYAWCGVRQNGSSYSGYVTITEGNCTLKGITAGDVGSCNGGGGGGGGGGAQGIVTFYQQINASHGAIAITVDGQPQGSITTYHPSGVTCGGGQVNVSMSAGIHSWSALASDGSHYEGNLNWPGNGACSTQRVETLLNPPTNSFAGWTFWCHADQGHGYITIYVDGVEKGQITHFSANGPTCGQGEVNVQMPSGSHLWGARATDGTTWGTEFSPPDFTGNPTAILFDDQCHRMQL